MLRFVVVAQGFVQIFVALSAMVSGVLLILSPSGALLQASTEMLKGSPFHDFLIPGVILTLVNGVGQLVAGVLTLRRHPAAAFVGMVFGLGLTIWIFVQVNMIGGGHILQFSYFALGILEAAFAFLMQSSARVREHSAERPSFPPGV